MAQYDPRVAQAYNEAIAAGLSPDQAERAAGITNDNAYLYVVGIDGSLQQNVIGPPKRPNETIVPPGASIGYGDDDDEPRFSTGAVSSQVTTTSQTTVTGGGSRTTTITPTTYRDTDASRSLQAQANDLAAQKAARSAELRAQGATGAQVINDPQYRELSRNQQNLENQAQSAKEVDQAGTATVVVTPGQNGTTFETTVDQQYLTTKTAVTDAQVEQSEADRIPVATPVTTSTAAVVNDPGYGGDFVFDDNGELIPADSLAAQDIRTQPAPVSNLYSAAFDPETQTWGVWDNNTGVFVQTGLSESSAQSAAQGFDFRTPTVQPITAPRAVGGNFAAEFNDGTGPGDAGTWYVVNQDTGEIVEVNLSEQQAENVAAGLSRGDPGYADVGEVPGVTVGNFGGDTGLLPDQVQAQADQAALEAAARERARVQAVLENQQRQADQGDWRVKIRLAPGARYLYRGSDGQGTGAGIMAPLAVTDGVIFPYTPQIETSYRARYTEQDLTHSNYRGYFYHGSHVDTVQITGVFTAQDTQEANYLLAVIHFFRSATKMFYGQDEVFGGAPPPVVFLQGLGQYQFSRHPCVISTFTYRLPNDVDYIRADVQPISGLNIQVARDRARQDLPTNIFTGALARLSAAGTPKGAINIPPPPATLGQTSPTYVPTKMEISIELLPMQTRSQVSREFSLEKFSNGNLQRGGFW